MNDNCLCFLLFGTGAGLLFGVLGTLILFFKAGSAVQSLVDDAKIDREEALAIVQKNRTLLFMSVMAFAMLVVICTTVIRCVEIATSGANCKSNVERSTDSSPTPSATAANSVSKEIKRN